MYKELEKFKIIKTIESNGIKCIHEAYDDDLGRYILLHSFDENYNPDKEEVEYFNLRAKYFSELDHDNFCELLEIGHNNKHPFIKTSNYKDCHKLSEYIADKRITNKLWIDFAILLSETIHSIHQKQIFHGNIASNNITIRDHKDILSFKIMSIEPFKIYRTGDSFEKIVINKDVDIKFFGFLLYEIFSGGRILNENNYYNTEIKKISYRNTNIIFPIRKIIDKCVVQNSKKFDNIKEIIKELLFVKKYYSFFKIINYTLFRKKLLSIIVFILLIFSSIIISAFSRKYNDKIVENYKTRFLNSDLSIFKFRNEGFKEFTTTENLQIGQPANTYYKNGREKRIREQYNILSLIQSTCKRYLFNKRSEISDLIVINSLSIEYDDFVFDSLALNNHLPRMIIHGNKCGSEKLVEFTPTILFKCYYPSGTITFEKQNSIGYKKEKIVYKRTTAVKDKSIEIEGGLTNYDDFEKLLICLLDLTAWQKGIINFNKNEIIKRYYDKNKQKIRNTLDIFAKLAKDYGYDNLLEISNWGEVLYNWKYKSIDTTINKLDELCESEPENALYNYSRGVILLQNFDNNLDVSIKKQYMLKPIKSFQNTIKSYSKNVTIEQKFCSHINLSFCYYILNDFESCIVESEKAFKIYKDLNQDMQNKLSDHYDILTKNKQIYQEAIPNS